MISTKVMPPTWMLIAITAMLILNFLFPVVWIVPSLWNLTGLVLLASGIALKLVADNAFKQVGTTVKPYQKSSNLVTNGVFQISQVEEQMLAEQFGTTWDAYKAKTRRWV